MCLFEYGLACDANRWPLGVNTSATPRPRLGNVPYGKFSRHCTVKGTIALTFDDGPGEWTSDLLDILKMNDVKATFFMIGVNIWRGTISDPAAIVRRMYEEGHQVAAHTWSHKDMNKITSQQRRHEMFKTEIALNNVLGFIPTYWRPPYNSCGIECERDMGDLGYHVVRSEPV